MSDDSHPFPARRVWGLMVPSSNDIDRIGYTGPADQISIMGDMFTEQEFDHDTVTVDMIRPYVVPRLDRWAYVDEWKPYFSKVWVKNDSQTWEPVQVLLWDGDPLRARQGLIDAETSVVREAVLEYFKEKKIRDDAESAPRSRPLVQNLESANLLRGRRKRQARRHRGSVWTSKPSNTDARPKPDPDPPPKKALRGRQRRRQRRGVAYGWQPREEQPRTVPNPRPVPLDASSAALARQFDVPPWAISSPHLHVLFECDGEDARKGFAVPIRQDSSRNLLGCLVVCRQPEWFRERGQDAIRVKIVRVLDGQRELAPRRYWSKFTNW
jgi:hypothetical protein